MNTDERPNWWGHDVLDGEGDRWYYVPGMGRYVLEGHGESYRAMQAYYPNPFTPAEPFVTWRADGTGCTWDMLEAACKEGGQARIRNTDHAGTRTYEGTLISVSSYAAEGEDWAVAGVFLRQGCDEITVWHDPKPDWWGAKVVKLDGNHCLYLYDESTDEYRFNGDPTFDPWLYTTFGDRSVTVIVDREGKWQEPEK